MKKIYQTITGSHKGTPRGNCMQAAIASLLELPLDEVPNFIEYNSDWFNRMYSFLRGHGYEILGTLYNDRRYLLEPNPELIKLGENRFHKLKEMDGVNGFFFASVLSPKYYVKEELPHCTHAVIIDKDLNIVHDVNPEYKDLKEYPEAKTLKYGGIIDIYMIEKTSEDKE